MGITLTRFVLYPSDQAGSPYLLARVIRPAAPNFAQPAVDFAEDLADAKAHALVRAYLVATSAESARQVPEAIGTASLDVDEPSLAEHPLNGLHGSEFEVWWTASHKRPTRLAIGPSHGDGQAEAEFWRWLDESVSDRQLAEFRRPAERIRVRLITEADVRLVDHPLLLVEDLDWLSAEEFSYLHRDGGLEAELADVLATHPVVTAKDIWAVKLGLVRRALASDLSCADRRTAAFRCSDLARFDPDATIVLIEELAAAVDGDDDRSGIVWALAYALHSLRGRAECEALIERWRARDGLAAEVLAELAGL